MSIKDIDGFFEGYVSPEMAAAFDMPHAAAQALRDTMGPAGAIGIVVGMCVFKPPVP